MSFEQIISNFFWYVERIASDPFFALNFLRVWGWLVLLFPIIWMAHWALYYQRLGKDRAKWKFILLAIDVPRDNEQGPKAIESMFAHLAGAHATRDIYETYWEGQTQKWFSFEIVSIEGYVQFLIHTEVAYRNLVEAMIYAQYPDAEITEVEDYTQGIPDHYPNDEYDMWGADFRQVKSQYYPIKSWREYEDPLAGVFHDPMAGLLETMSRMGPGEQLWVQLLIKPIGIEWKSKGYEMVREMAGKPKMQKDSMMSKVGSAPGVMLDTAVEAVMGGEAGALQQKKDEPPSMMLHLTPGERGTLEAIERKLSKIGFSCKMRIIYVAKKESFKKTNAVQAIVGSIKQFNTEDLNAIIPDMKRTAVTAHYVMIDTRKNWRKERLMNWYKRRNVWAGTPEYVLNTEELATLWHFPVMTVRAPLLAKTQAKRAEPPSRIPTGSAPPIRPKSPQGS